MTWRRPRARPSLCLAVFAVAVVAVLFWTAAPEAKREAEVATKIVKIAGAHIAKEDMHTVFDRKKRRFVQRAPCQLFGRVERLRRVQR